jgi:hypothetical protein
MTNLLEVPRKLARMAMVELENALPIGKLVYREYASEYGRRQTGTILSINRPVQFQAQRGQSSVPQPIEDGVVNLTVGEPVVVHWELNTQQMALNDELLSERFARPAARSIANAIERSIFEQFRRVPHWVGTPGQLVRVRGDVGRAVARLKQNGMPAGEDVAAVMTTADLENLSNDVSRLANVNDATGAFRDGVAGMVGGAKVVESNIVENHTRGLWSTSGIIEVDGANQTSTYAATRNNYQQTLNVKGGSNNVTGWAREGDVIEIEGVFAVNPVTKQVYSHRRQFVVRADANTNGSGLAALTISPPIITSGPYQTVSAAPADSADIFVIGSSTGPFAQNIAFHKNAFALATIRLPAPPGAVVSESMNYKGYNMAMTASYDINNGTSSVRLETQFAVGCINPELAVRFSGSSA